MTITCLFQQLTAVAVYLECLLDDHPGLLNGCGRPEDGSNDVVSDIQHSSVNRSRPHITQPPYFSTE